MTITNATTNRRTFLRQGASSISVAALAPRRWFSGVLAAPTVTAIFQSGWIRNYPTPIGLAPDQQFCFRVSTNLPKRIYRQVVKAGTMAPHPLTSDWMRPGEAPGKTILVPLRLVVSDGSFRVEGTGVEVLSYPIAKPGDAQWLVRGFMEALLYDHSTWPHDNNIRFYSDGRPEFRKFVAGTASSYAILTPESRSLTEEFGRALECANNLMICHIEKPRESKEPGVAGWRPIFSDVSAHLDKLKSNLSRQAANPLAITHYFSACSRVEDMVPGDWRTVIFANRD